MRYNFFLHYGWFFQNLGKEAVRTNMHTTVAFPAGLSRPWSSQDGSKVVLGRDRTGPRDPEGPGTKEVQKFRKFFIWSRDFPPLFLKLTI